MTDVTPLSPSPEEPSENPDIGKAEDKPVSGNTTPLFVTVVGKVVLGDGSFEYGQDGTGLWGRRGNGEKQFRLVSMSQVPGYVRRQFTGGFYSM